MVRLQPQGRGPTRHLPPPPPPPPLAILWLPAIGGSASSAPAWIRAPSAAGGLWRPPDRCRPLLTQAHHYDAGVLERVARPRSLRDLLARLPDTDAVFSNNPMTSRPARCSMPAGGARPFTSGARQTRRFNDPMSGSGLSGADQHPHPCVMKWAQRAVTHSAAALAGQRSGEEAVDRSLRAEARHSPCGTTERPPQATAGLEARFTR